MLDKVQLDYRAFSLHLTGWGIGGVEAVSGHIATWEHIWTVLHPNPGEREEIPYSASVPVPELVSRPSRLR
jgi:hypothetical protein